MKKILLLCLLVLAICTPVYAAEIDDVKQLATDLKDLSYRLETGMDYEKFNDTYNDLYAKEQKFEDSYPNSDKKYDFKKVLNTYNDARQVWFALLGKEDKFNKMLVAEKFRPELESKYPNFNNKVQKNGVRWDGESTLKTLFQYAKEYQKPLAI